MSKSHTSSTHSKCIADKTCQGSEENSFADMEEGVFIIELLVGIPKQQDIFSLLSTKKLSGLGVIAS